MLPYLASNDGPMVSHSVNSAHCPFCKQAISAELAQYGGNCPKCMLEIPGEDAPTDPGAHLRAKQEAEKQVVAEQQRKRRWVGWVIGGVAAVVLLGVGVARLKQEQDALTYNLDDYYVMPLEDITVASPAPEAGQAATPTAAATPAAKATPVAVSSGTRAVMAAPEGAAASAVHSASGASDALPPELAAAMAATGGGGGLGGANISVTRPDVVLSDPAEIKAMIGRVLAGSRPQLNACYQQRLKQVEDLRGTWDLQFTVATSGGATNVDASGRDRADGELEACMERAVAGWKFSKVAKPVGPVQVPFQFSAS